MVMDKVVDKLKDPKDSHHHEKLGVQQLQWNVFTKYNYFITVHHMVLFILVSLASLTYNICT
jgi:hypothetical protein